MSNTVEKKLTQYKGILSATQIADGMNAAIQNAQRLLNSAQVIFNAEDYPTSTSLAILAVEESGKSGILRSIALTKDEKYLKKLWKSYRTHTKKNISWSIECFIWNDIIRLDDFKKIFALNNSIPYKLDFLKQLGFYTDCLGDDGHWCVPATFITREDASHVLERAKRICRNKEVSVKEIELWIECLSPVWMKSMDEMKQGLLQWRRKMRDTGLITEPDHFDKFVTLGWNIGGTNE